MENENKKILLIEDDEGFVYILRKSLEKEGFLIVVSGTGEDGIEKAKTEKPDLIILDVLLPGIDGTQVAAKLKEAGSNIPIMYLSNVNDPKRISQGIVASGGEADFIVKTDVHVDEIIERIKKRLSLK